MQQGRPAPVHPGLAPAKRDRDGHAATRIIQTSQGAMTSPPQRREGAGHENVSYNYTNERSR